MQEFKDFAMKGNVIDLAVGVIIGGAFGKIVASIVNDIIMPPIGLLVGGIKFSDLKLVLSRAADGSVATALSYGNFLQTTLEFVIIAACVFMMIKALAKLQKKAPPAPATPAPTPADIVLLTEIRDLLKK